MAKTAPAPAVTEQTSLATTAPANDQLAAFNAVFGDTEPEADGLEEADSDDIKTPSVVFNLKGTDGRGYDRTLRDFMFTDTEEYTKELRFIMVAYAKSHRFAVFNEGDNKNQVICTSYDRVRGVMRAKHPKLEVLQGTDRPCEKCPDMQWFKDDKGKNKRNCSEVSNVFSLLVSEERDKHGLIPVSALGREFMIRFGKTSLQPFEGHLNKHHFKKHPTIRGKNVALYAYEVVLTMEPQKGGVYAIPVFTKGAMISAETKAVLEQISKDFRETRELRMAAAEKQEEKHAGAIDTEGESSTGGARRDEFADDDRA
jgi:hypothetical protein